MVKAYLRYEGDRSIGVIASRECNIAFDRTGRQVLTGCVEAVGVWSLRQGAQVRALSTTRSLERVTRICLEGGKRSVCAVGYSDGTVRVWNYEEAAVLQTLQGHRSAVSALAFDRAGQMLASGGCDTDIVLWDLVAESGVARLRGHVDQVTAVVFWEAQRGGDSAAGTSSARLISASKDRFVRIWSVELQLCLQTLAEHQSEVWSLSLNAEQSRLAAGSTDKFVRVWAMLPEGTGGEDSPLAKYIGAVPRPQAQGNVLALEFAKPKGCDFEVLLCQGSGRVLELFFCHDLAEVRKRQRRRKKRVQVKQQKKAEKAGASASQPEAREAAEKAEDGAEDDGPRAADELSALPAHRCSAKAMSMAWSASASAVLVGLSNNSMETVKLVKTDEGSVSAVAGVTVDLAGHRTGIRSLAVSHDDSLLMSASAEAIKIWSVPTGRCVRTMPSGYGLCSLFVAGNEHVLLGTKEGALELYDLRVAEACQREEVHSGAIYGIAARPDNKGFVTCSADKHLRFFELKFLAGPPSTVSFEEQAEKAQELQDECLSVAYSANGKWIVVALLNHTVQMYFADTLKFYLALYGHRLPVMSLDISSDSQIVASGSADKNVKLWSPQFGNCLKSLRAHEESVMQVRFLPGTHYLATAGRDRELKLWDCDSYELIISLRGHASEILAMALSQDAAFIVTASSDRQLRFWRRTGEQLFLSEERAKELEDRFEQEVEREDVQAPAGGEVVALRPSRRTVESVRSTERLMELLDEATALESGEDVVSLDSRHPCVRIISYVNTLTASNIYEVLLALPFSHAFRLLQFICRFFEAVATLPEGGTEEKKLSAAATLETPCQAALITTYVHHRELAATSAARPLLLQLRRHMRELLQAEKDRIGLSMAGFSHLQRVMKRSRGSVADLAPKQPQARSTGSPGASTGDAKKRRQK